MRRSGLASPRLASPRRLASHRPPSVAWPPAHLATPPPRVGAARRQVNQQHKKNDFFLVPRAAGLRKFKEEEAFVVRHFAGNVCYMSAGFMDKNNDTLHPDFEAALSASTNALLATLFVPDGSGKKRNASFNSVGRRFINDLDTLMTDLGSTHAHFIRCLKPNLALQPQVVAPSLVLSQLRCSGTLEAVQLISASYPTRIPYDDIYGRYKEHMPDFVQRLEPSYFTEAIALACDVDEEHYQLGRSKIFLRPGTPPPVLPLLLPLVLRRNARAHPARAHGHVEHPSACTRARSSQARGRSSRS